MCTVATTTNLCNPSGLCATCTAMPCCTAQKSLYQQQPLQVMLRGQPTARPMPLNRPPQRTVNGQSNVASLSIHDKRRQPVMPVKRYAGSGSY